MGVLESLLVTQGQAMHINGACGYCSGPFKAVIHSGPCPRVKAVEYHPNGTVKRIEYHPVLDPETPEGAMSDGISDGLGSAYERPTGAEILPRCGRCGVACVEEADGQPCGEGVWSASDVRLGDCGGMASWKATALMLEGELARWRDAQSAAAAARQEALLAERSRQPTEDLR